MTPGAFQTNGATGDCFLGIEPCGDSFLTRITLDGPVLAPTPQLAVSPIELAPGDTFTATWGGIVAPTSDDRLVLYALGERSDSFIFLPTYETMGMAEGSLAFALPETVVPGSYELRLLTPNPEALPLLATVARTEPLTVLPPITLVPTLEAGNILSMEVLGLRAGPYRVEASESMHPADWQIVTNGLVEPGQIAEFREPMASGSPRRFFRVSQ